MVVVDNKSKILMLSLDNHQVKNLIGGKHVHQKLLLREWDGLGHQTLFISPQFPWLLNKLLNVLFKLMYLEQVHLAKIKYKFYKNKLNKQLKKINFNEYILISIQDVYILDIISDSILQKIKDKAILTLHGYLALENCNYLNHVQDRLSGLFEFYSAIEKRAYTKINKIVTVDSRIKNYLITEYKLNENNIHVIFNAVDENNFYKPTKDEMSQLRHDLNISESNLIIMVARRLVVKNGVKNALLVMLRILQEYSNVEFYILGDGPEKIKLNEILDGQIQQIKERVKLIGTVDYNKINKWYKAVDILLMPSTNVDGVEEATSLSMIEGMICGKVVIGSQIGGIAEVIKDCVTGLLFPDKDLNAFYLTIVNVINNINLRENIGNKAHEYAYQYHSSRLHAIKFLELV
jgi:glycosyltransferase involved in cell wall biosynthesis